MALDATGLAAIRQWVGSAPDDDDLDERYDRLSSAEAVALEVLQIRRADLVANGRSLSISGHGSQGSTTEQVKSLDESIGALIAVLTGRPYGLEVLHLSRSDRARPCDW